MGWFTPRCPVNAVEQQWIEESFDWLVGQFGEQVTAGPVILPTSDYFPGSYSGALEDIERICTQVCQHMGVDAGSVRLEIIDETVGTDFGGGYPRAQVPTTGTAGHYVYEDGHHMITLEQAQTHDPMVLIATLAHELGHARLLGEGRISPSRRDGEPLTDLATVALGLGVFTANASFDFVQDNRGWRTGRLGYLTEQMFGYALAWYARRRGERQPEWAAYLDVNPAGYVKAGLRFLERQ